MNALRPCTSQTHLVGYVQMKVHILGPQGSHDVLLGRLLASGEMSIWPTVVYNWLLVRNAIRAGAMPEDVTHLGVKPMRL